MKLTSSAELVHLRYAADALEKGFEVLFQAAAEGFQCITGHFFTRDVEPCIEDSLSAVRRGIATQENIDPETGLERIRDFSKNSRHSQ